MVQITLAFVIILGYLVSKGISESRDLAAETALQRKQNQLRLQQIVADFSSPKRDANESSGSRPNDRLQIQKLLNRWLRIRENRLFYQLVNTTAMQNSFRCLTTCSRCRSNPVSTN